jgi:hypothetical protein
LIGAESRKEADTSVFRFCIVDEARDGLGEFAMRAGDRAEIDIGEVARAGDPGEFGNGAKLTQCFASGDIYESQ